jgi:prepilin-type processing-associated H-X9-DG protein
MFACQNGLDRVPGSPTFGQPVQLSYAFGSCSDSASGAKLVHISNGNGTSNVLFAWEHVRAPACATSGSFPVGVPPFEPWPIDDEDAPQHYPERRHSGLFNACYADAHVEALRSPNLRLGMFRYR